MSHNVLILGASGRFGRHAAEAFWNAGWRVREVPRLTARVIAAAQASGATVLIPGNVYGYGAGSGPLIDETTPKAATNPLGRIRNEMEAAYRNAVASADRNH